MSKFGYVSRAVFGNNYKLTDNFEHALGTIVTFSSTIGEDDKELFRKWDNNWRVVASQTEIARILEEAIKDYIIVPEDDIQKLLILMNGHPMNEKFIDDILPEMLYYKRGIKIYQDDTFHRVLKEFWIYFQKYIKELNISNSQRS